MAKTWEWRMRSWTGTRSQRGLAEARLTLAAGVEAGPGTISQRGLGDWASCQRRGCEAGGCDKDGVFATLPERLIGFEGREVNGSGATEADARRGTPPGKGGRGGGGPRVQVMASAGCIVARNEIKANENDLAINPTKQGLTAILQLAEGILQAQRERKARFSRGIIAF